MMILGCRPFQLRVSTDVFFHQLFSSLANRTRAKSLIKPETWKFSLTHSSLICGSVQMAMSLFRFLATFPQISFLCLSIKHLREPNWSILCCILQHNIQGPSRSRGFVHLDYSMRTIVAYHLLAT